jgi:hypothetical protein
MGTADSRLTSAGPPGAGVIPSDPQIMLAARHKALKRLGFRTSDEEPAAAIVTSA